MPTRSQQLRAWLFALDRFELKLRVASSRARNAFIRQAAKEYAVSGSVPNHALTTHRARLQSILTGHYRTVIPHFAVSALTNIKSHRIGEQAVALLSRTPEPSLYHLEEMKARFSVKSTDRFMAHANEWITREALRKATLISDTDMEDVRNQLGAGMAEGIGTEQIARNIRKVTQLTPYRAATVARTETHAAATYGSIESVRDAEQELGVVMKKEWLPTMDDRTRPEHRAMAGQPPIPMNEKFSVGGELMDRPGDPSGSPANIVNCLHPDSVIQSGRIKAMTRHWYEGDLIVIETVAGNKLTITPNHPVLSPLGWKAASAIQVGDDIIGSRFGQRVCLGNLDVQNVVTSAKQIYDSLAVVGVVVGVGRADVNFHGERPDSDVDVVRPAGKLRDHFVTACSKPLDHFRLACTDFAQGRLLAQCLLLGSRLKELWWLVADSFMGFLRQLQPSFGAGVRHPGIHAFAAVPRLDAVVREAEGNVPAITTVSVGKRLNRLTSKKPASDFLRMFSPFLTGREATRFGSRADRDAEIVKLTIQGGPVKSALAGQLPHARASKVFVDQVISINHMAYSGYVYNLETNNGYYICNGIVNHNCRCALAYTEATE